MKNTENAERPISAMVYSPSRRGPLRWSGRPAQTPFSSAIRDSRTVTEPSSQRSRRAARQNQGEAGKIHKLLHFRLTLAVASVLGAGPRPGRLCGNATHSHLESLRKG